MKIAKFALAGVVAALVLAGIAMAEQSASEYDDYMYDDYMYFTQAEEEAEEQKEEPSKSPSDLPPKPVEEPAQDDVAALLVEDGCGAACDTGGGSCGSSCCGSVFGWIDGGILFNSENPASDFNGPVTFNDRDGEFLVNQLYLVFEKAVDTGGCGWGVGGRIDVLYGTDARFTKAAGWELRPDFTDRWNKEGQQYQISIPQLYAEVAHNNMSLKLGHFYTIIGYEGVTAPDVFFYTHPYAHQYGEPFTHFGGLLSWDVGRWTLSGGLVNGWDALDRVDDRASFLGGITYTPCHECWSLAFAIITGTEDDDVGGTSDRTMYSVVFDWNVTNRLEYVLQHDWGTQVDFSGPGDDAVWYGVNQYLFYQLNCCWKAGLRVEWFRDGDGVRVAGVDPGNPYGGGSIGNFYEISLGLNWTPCENLVVRPECRWDWFDGRGTQPYDDGNSDDQFLVGFDVIYTY